MKKILILFAAIVISMSSFSQNPISKAEWQADLEWLQNTVHHEYPFLFKKIDKTEWDGLVKELSNQIPEMENHEIMVGFSRIVSAFLYGHTSLGFRGGPVKFHRLPINLYRFSDGVYIQGSHVDYRDILGARVVAIEGVPIEEVLEIVKPVFAVENDQFYKAYGTYLLCVPEVLHAQGIMKDLKTSVTYTLDKAGSKFEKDINGQQDLDMPISYGYMQSQGDWLDARDTSITPNYLKHLDKIYYSEYFPEEKALYVRQSQIADDPEENIPTFYNRIFEYIDQNEVEKFILDVRLNGGGNNYLNKPIITGLIKSEKINQIGKLYVIIGRRTFSACQNLVNELDNYTNVIFVGEPTGENINFYGDNRRMELPNSKMPLRLSFAWWQDKPQWENAPWTTPHQSVDISFKEYINNEDPVLAAALSFSGDGFIIDPMQHFTNLFMSGNIGQLQKDAAEMMADPRYSFFDFEGEFTKAGTNLLKGGQVMQAVFVFNMVTESFPESPQAWSNLAEAFVKLNNVEKAKEIYTKVMELDPEGLLGIHAQTELERLSKGK